MCPCPHSSLPSNRHFDLFCCYRRLTNVTNGQTHRQTHRRCYSVCSIKPNVMRLVYATRSKNESGGQKLCSLGFMMYQTTVPNLTLLHGVMWCAVRVVFKSHARCVIKFLTEKLSSHWLRRTSQKTSDFLSERIVILKSIFTISYTLRWTRSMMSIGAWWL